MPSDPPSTVLVVDDEESIREYLRDVLQFEGYRCVSFSQSLAALSYLAEGSDRPDLILADIAMPDLGGIELVRSVKSAHPELPVILVSGLYELAATLEAIEAGADDCLKKPILASDLTRLIGKYLQSEANGEQEAVQESIRELLSEQTRDIEDSPHIREIFRRLGFKRYETFQHSKRVAAYAALLGRYCGLPRRELERLQLGGLLHDIGKIGVPANVLQKPGNLSAEEWKLIRSHPAIGYKLLAESPQLEAEAEIVYCHHEQYDGQGYPRGLKGTAIPFRARLFSIVDTLDAITSDRAYRQAQPFEEARREIARLAGVQFDPQLVGVFLEIPTSDLQAIRTRYPDMAA